MSRLTRDGTAKPVSRDQILRREHGGQGKRHFPCSADHEQNWQPYPVDSYSCYIYGTIHIYIHAAVCVFVWSVLRFSVERSGIIDLSRHLKIFVTVAI